MYEGIIESGPNWDKYAGPTPNGGTVALWMYSLEDGSPATRETATCHEIHELDDSGKCLFRTYARPPSKDIPASQRPGRYQPA